MKKTITSLVSLFLLASLSSGAAAYVEVVSCYAKPFKSRDFSQTEEKYFTDLSYFKVEEVQTDRIRFVHKMAGANGHQCFVPGFAKKIDDSTYIYIDRQEFWSVPKFELYDYSSRESIDRCLLLFRFEQQAMSITVAGKCGNYCGARASLGGQLPASADSELCSGKLVRIDE